MHLAGSPESGTSYRLGRNRNPDAELPTSEVQSFNRRLDLQNHRMRTEVTSANFLAERVLIEADDYTPPRGGPA
ncbi:MAG: hypothetical protein HY701_03175, partial [Gemmatimonadetes bacterium]|nr:hypothetical protein [Gemmatimonadota bacterium]